jgi:hypothetical protein
VLANPNTNNRGNDHMLLKRLLMAMAVSAIALPVAAQSATPAQPAAPMASEMKGQEKMATKKTPEQVAKDKATAAKQAEDVKKGGAPMPSEMKGQEKMATKKTPEQVAKEKADKAKRGTTPEEQAKQAKQLPGG